MINFIVIEDICMKAEKKFTEFINFDKVESFKNFGGIRIEDDVLVTDNGYRVLGKPMSSEAVSIPNGKYGYIFMPAKWEFN